MGFRSSGGLPVACSSVSVAQQAPRRTLSVSLKKTFFLSSAVTTLAKTEF